MEGGAHEFWLAGKTIRKMLESSTPPGYSPQMGQVSVNADGILDEWRFAE